MDAVATIASFVRKGLSMFWIGKSQSISNQVVLMAKEYFKTLLPSSIMVTDRERKEENILLYDQEEKKNNYIGVWCLTLLNTTKYSMH